MSTLKKMTLEGLSDSMTINGMVLDSNGTRQTTVRTMTIGDTDFAVTLKTTSFNSAKQSYIIRLYDKNNTLVESYRNSLTSSIVFLKCTKDIDVSSTRNANNGIVWDVAPDQFSTGRIQIEMYGKLSDTKLESYIDNNTEFTYAKNSTLTGSGHVEYSISFKIENA